MRFIRMHNQKGQNIVEYLLIFTVVMVVVLFALQPAGFLSKGISDSIDYTMNGVQNMAQGVYINGY